MSSAVSSLLAGVIADIKPVEHKYQLEANLRLDSLTKPRGSLGRLEMLAARLYGICAGNLSLPLRKSVVVFAADHGITEETVSTYPKEVTAQMVQNFLHGGAAINVLAKLHGVDLSVVDVGVDATFDKHPGLVSAKVRRGSRNLLREPAMSCEELHSALVVGLTMADAMLDKQLIAAGEMGIGNTTAASAITALLTGRQVEEVTGRGAGLNEAGIDAKVTIIRESLRQHFDSLDDVGDVLEVLRCVGGLEIAAMTGFMLGLARKHKAIVLDGFISTAAAGIAYALAPDVRDYLFAGHCSQEPGHRYLLDYLNLKPILNLEMRLGEGTGAVLAMPILESALHLYAEMATFTSAQVSQARQ